MDKSMGSMETVGGGSRQQTAEDLSLGNAPTLGGGAPGRRFRAGEVILGRYRVGNAGTERIEELTAW
ncbi:MAG: hypothetical protein GX608_02930 [Lentisphaerae bacterium]|nr:hypothetical protein [Lentisphaerota bacterium]